MPFTVYHYGHTSNQAYIHVSALDEVLHDLASGIVMSFG